jgi:hypothetical protein
VNAIAKETRAARLIRDVRLRDESNRSKKPYHKVVDTLTTGVVQEQNIVGSIAALQDPHKAIDRHRSQEWCEKKKKLRESLP